MPFVKGQKKTGGMKKGFISPQKQIVREVIEKSLGKSIPERLMELSGGDPDKETDILLDLMPYCYPKLQALQISHDPSQDKSPKELVEEREKDYEEIMRMKLEIKK